VFFIRVLLVLMRLSFMMTLLSLNFFITFFIQISFGNKLIIFEPFNYSFQAI